MFVYNDPYSQLFKIYFGDAQDKIFKDDLVNLAKEKNICESEYFVSLKKNIKFDSLVFLNQVHGTDGLVITSNKQAQFAGSEVGGEGIDSFMIKGVEREVIKGGVGSGVLKSFEIDGDFLVTNVAGVAIGVLTADCLPIVFVDIVNKVIAVAHAGWRGSIEKIAVKTVESMQKNFGTSPKDVQVFFGPCIKSCCYGVGEDFAKNLEGYEFAGDFLHLSTLKASAGMPLHEKPDGLYFDLPGFNVRILQELGIKRENISLDYNSCTFCDKNFFSYRRGDKEGRQMTVVCYL